MRETTSRTPKTGEVVADYLRRQIARGELNIGDHLRPEDELTAEFGVARTTLREGLRILESQGLIRIRRGRGGGGVVTQPDLDHIATALAVALQLQGTTMGDLDDARQLLEPQLVSLLAQHHHDQDIVALSEAIDAASAAAEANDTDAFGRAAAFVHETIMEQAGNRTLATVSRLLHGLVAAYYQRSASKSDQPRMQRAVRSYRKLLSLVEAGDADGAEEHWRRQMSYTVSGNDRAQPIDAFDE
jgi:GntR family transcriptional regulator, transcriptional repressor for pyruvate dehydrogenase complex